MLRAKMRLNKINLRGESMRRQRCPNCKDLLLPKPIGEVYNWQDMVRKAKESAEAGLFCGKCTYCRRTSRTEIIKMGW